VKRMCIKALPPVLVIQLKRFGYDWEAGRALKFDDHFEVIDSFSNCLGFVQYITTSADWFILLFVKTGPGRSY